MEKIIIIGIIGGLTFGFIIHLFLEYYNNKK